MGYSKYKNIKSVIKKFGLDADFLNIFPDIAPKPISPWLAETLQIAKLMPLTNEKTKSERIVSPVLLDIVRQFTSRLCLFSGEDLVVSPEDDLSGECDFFFSLHAPKPYIDFPIISLVEAKDDDMEWGLGQCAAQVYGAHLYNAAEGKSVPVLYGCATTGKDWQFFRFENNIFYVHHEEMTDLPQVIGTWHWILNYYMDNHVKKN
ncbi:MAG: hypothetical protein RLZZ292_2946 [Bacteroidota bacterium]|jgi:hypothetical protein